MIDRLRRFLREVDNAQGMEAVAVGCIFFVAALVIIPVVISLILLAFGVDSDTML